MERTYCACCLITNFPHKDLHLQHHKASVICPSFVCSFGTVKRLMQCNEYQQANNMLSASMPPCSAFNVVSHRALCFKLDLCNRHNTASWLLLAYPEQGTCHAGPGPVGIVVANYQIICFHCEVGSLTIPCT